MALRDAVRDASMASRSVPGSLASPSHYERAGTIGSREVFECNTFQAG
jgi:hypothetical protein